MTIEGRPWQLMVFARPDGTMANVPDSVRVDATFAAGRVTGSSGCNRYTGPYRVDGDRLELGPLAGTMMACPDPAMAVERGFLEATGRVARYAERRHSLELLDADGRVVLAFIASMGTRFVGTEWSATGINNGRGGVEGLIERTTATAVFGPDDRVSGFAGCNRFAAGYRVEGSTIRIGQAALTDRSCRTPAGLMAQETAFLAALRRSTHAAIDADRLELRDADGALQVSFRAVRP